MTGLARSSLWLELRPYAERPTVTVWRHNPPERPVKWVEAPLFRETEVMTLEEALQSAYAGVLELMRAAAEEDLH